MELCHADIYAGYETVEEAKRVMEALNSIPDLGEDEFGIMEVDDNGHPLGLVDE